MLRTSLRNRHGHPSRVQLLISQGWYDGTLSGICEFQGKKYTYKCLNLDLHYRTFELREVSDKYVYYSKIQRLSTSKESRDFNDDNVRVRGNGLTPTCLTISYNQWLQRHREWATRQSGPVIGYFDSNEFRFRTEKYRDYFIQGERLDSIRHNNACDMGLFIQWRADLHSFDEIEHFEGKSEHWGIKRSNGAHVYWLRVNYCFGCGLKLPVKVDLSKTVTP